MAGLVVRPLHLDEMEAAARVHRAGYDHALPHLAGRYTPDQDAWFYTHIVFPAGPVIGAFSGERLVGVMALRETWIDQLYLDPSVHRQGIGARLVDEAKRRSDTLNLYCFTCNHPARAFYAAQGFERLESRDGSANDENEPDEHWVWRQSK